MNYGTRITVGISTSSAGGDKLPAEALTLGGEPLTLGGEPITLNTPP